MPKPRFAIKDPRLAALLAYGLLALLFTWPLALHLATHVPGDGSDDPALAWNLWWVKHALLDLHVSPLQTDFMFYPIGLNLAYFTITLFNGLVAMPLQALFGLIAANNLVVLGYFALSGYGAYLLARFVLRGAEPALPDWIVHLAAFLAGVIFAFAPGKFLFAGFGQFNVLSTAWIPLYVLYLLQSGRPAIADPRPGRGDRALPALKAPVLAGLFLLIAALSEYTYASFLLIFTGFYLVYLWFADRRLVCHPRMARDLTIIAAIFLVGFSPFLYEMLREIRIEGDYMMAGWGFADVFSADLLGFFVPSVLHPVFGEWAKQFRFTYTNFATIGVTTLALSLLGLFAARKGARGETNESASDAVVALPAASDPGATSEAATAPAGPLPAATPHSAFRIPRFHAPRFTLHAPRPSPPALRFWFYSAVAFFVLMLGPVLHINGRYVFDLDGLAVRFPLPFILLHYVPLIKGNRYPSRYEVMLMLCLAVLAAWGVAWLLVRLSRGAAGARWPAGRLPAAVAFLAILALVCFESLSIPLPLSNLTVPAIYSQIAQEPGDFTVLELPLGWRNGFRVSGAQNAVIMYQQFYQTTSQKRMLGGNTSRNPEFKFDYFVQAPVIRSFIALEEQRPLPPNAQEQDKRLAADVLRFFDVRYVIVHPPYTGTDLERYAQAVLPLERIYQQDGIVAYRVSLPAPSQTISLSLAGELGGLYRGEGWSEVEGTYRWVQRQDARLFLPLAGGQAYRLALRVMAPGPGQRVSLTLNGAFLAALPLAEGWQELAVDLPGDRVRQGLNQLTFGYDRAFPLLPGQTIGATGVAAPANIVARGAGQEAGDYAHIYVNGQDVVPGRRGYNLAVLNPQTGAVEQAGSYDTFESAAESSRLAEFINKLPAGRIVALAVRDEASLHLGQDAQDALSTLGATVDLRGKFRWGHVVIGVKGAAPGTALESAGRDAPLQVYVGRNVTTAEVGLAVESIQATPVR